MSRVVGRRSRSASVISASHTSNSLTPITAHYSLNMTLKKAFYKLRESNQYSTALAVGMQFCRIALFYIPKHGYYDSPKYDGLKAQNAQDAVLISDLAVTEILPQLIHFNKTKRKNSMSELDGKLQEAKILREAARVNAKLVISQRSKMASNCYNQRTVEVVDHHSRSSRSWLRSCGECETLCGGVKNVVWPTSNPLNVVRENDAETYANNEGYVSDDKQMTYISDGYMNQYQNAEVKFERSTSAPPILTKKKSRRQLIQREPVVKEQHDQSRIPHRISLVDGDDCSVEHPGEKDVVSEQAQFQSDLDRALYLSSLELQRHSRQESYTSISQSSSSSMSFSIESKIENTILKYQGYFHRMSQEQRIRVEFLNTYQGRIRESTNGCTVIAPLMAIHHVCDLESLKIRNPVLLKVDSNRSYDLNSPTQNRSNSMGKSIDNVGIEDDIIIAVIDIQTPLVVPQVRKHLGLYSDALIVPSDVHDYLIDGNFLHQNQFVGVHGGNILDIDHLGGFLRDFTEYGFDDKEWTEKNDGKIKKVAATFYFHEHVICIHRQTVVHQSDDGSVLNSTKRPKSNCFHSLRGCGRKSSGKKFKESNSQVAEEVTFDVIDSLPSARTVCTQNRTNAAQASGFLEQTTRIRCIGRKSLYTYLMWYACSKFSQEDQLFIDSYQFDENKVDLDPRVFQTFIWSE